MPIFSSRRAHLDKISWSEGRRGQTNLAYYVDCYNNEGLQTIQEGQNMRHGWLGNPHQHNTASNVGEILQWLQHKSTDVLLLVRNPRRSFHADYLLRYLKGRYAAPSIHTSNGSPRGGFRLLLCDRKNMNCGMSISRTSFEALSATFNLHQSTLTALCMKDGVYAKYISQDSQSGDISRLSIVVKANQKVEIGNYVLSMSHDLATHWTTAIICGDGAIIASGLDRFYGNQLDQILTSIRTSYSLWPHPLFLPAVILGNLCQRIELRTQTLERALLDCEDNLGVTVAGGAGSNVLSRTDWPKNVEVKKTTIDVHSTDAQIIFLLRTCDWAIRYSKFLQELDHVLEHQYSLNMDTGLRNQWREAVLFTDSVLQGMHGFFSSMQDRIQTQIGVLYNVINQQDSKLNGLIAASAKQDSIAMMTFTFITALFLPGTYISSLFSMSMFNWQSSQLGTDSHLSSYFWLYWAVTIPLTLITLGGWFLWYRYSDLEWNETMKENLGIDVKLQRPRTKGNKLGRLLKAMSWSGH